MSLPTNWSLSKLGQFTKCRRKFLYSYIQRLPSKKGVAASRGIEMHAQIEAYFISQAELPAPLAHYQEWFDVLRGMDHTAEEKLAMREGWLSCVWEDPDAWWKGVLDLSVRQAPRAWVFDWKSGKIYPDHEDQKELYAIATFVRYEDIHEIESTHVYLDLGKNTTVRYRREQLPALIAKWNGKLVPYMQALKLYDPETADMFFVCNPSYLCNYCDFSKSQGGPCPF